MCRESIHLRLKDIGDVLLLLDCEISHCRTVGLPHRAMARSMNGGGPVFSDLSSRLQPLDLAWCLILGHGV